ncbi:MAG TPA: polymorphic toxin type 15 domain-containing protein, partial [Spirillospora sp.]|nr:polymorphic toxin type 15 domain-containing protein [Spirillospora sp.]
RAGGAARAQAAMPPAESAVAEARGAVTEPEAETQARAEEALVTVLDERPEPSAEIEELCARIRQVIRDKRPPDEDSLTEAEPNEMAREAGGQLNENVEGDVGRVQGEYNQMQEQPEGTPASEPTPMEGTPPAQDTASIDAAQAVPDPVPAEAVSLDADVEANQQRMEDAGMMSETAQVVQDGPIAEAREAQGELEETAERDPQEVLAEQEAAIASAQSDMADLQARAVAALQEARTSTTSESSNQQVQMVGSEEQMRAEVGRRANEIFDTAQSRVDGLLRDLPQTAMQRWETGIARHSETFKQSLRRVQNWVDERHESTLLAVWDYVAGLPDWVTEEYNRAEREFGDNVCELMREISREVNGVVAACQAIIQQARQDIEALYASLPAEMQAWAQEEQARFSERLDGLSNRANETRDNFNRDLRQRASQAVQDVRQQIHELRQAARGLIGRVVDAVTEFLEDPVRAIINGLLNLVGIPPASFWALVDRIQQVISDIANDPLNFANNLMQALKLGFQQFFDNIGRHLLNGLLQWLFSAMGNVGVTIPSDFSLKSVITFFLQIMGITWARIRRLLAKHIGEQNVALIEQAWQIISTLIEQGPQGIFEMIKDQLNPQAILDMILQTAIDFVIETLIKQVALRIIGMLNPAGAIVQAIELIYKLLKWLFENAARIFTLIETIVNGAADLIAGNIGGMATAVEGALARILPIVIDFLAGLLGLGDLPDKIAGAVKRLQDMVERILDRVIGFLADRARALLRRLMGGHRTGEPDQPDERTAEQKQQDLQRGLRAAQDVLNDPAMSPDEVQQKLPPIKQRYRLQELRLVKDSETDVIGVYHIQGRVNPPGSGPQVSKRIRMPLATVTFYYRRHHSVAEYERQLRRQEASINNMYILRWWRNRQAYAQRRAATGSGRDPSSRWLQQDFRARIRAQAITQFLRRGMSQSDAEQRADSLLARRAALHDPDQVAGGEVTGISALGAGNINSSIGAQWSSRVPIIEAEVQKVPKSAWNDVRMNVRLLVTLNPRDI